MIQVHIAVSVALRNLRRHITLILLRVNIGDESLLRLEVKGHRIVLIGVFTHFEYGRAKLLSCRVARTSSMHQTGVHRHVNLVARQIHILVFYVRLTIQESQLRVTHIHHRVFGGILHRSIDTILALAVQRVGTQRVVNLLIVQPDGFPQRIHACRIQLQRVGIGRILQQCGEEGFPHRNRVLRNAVLRNRITALSTLGKAQPRHLCHHKNDDKKG